MLSVSAVCVECKKLGLHYNIMLMFLAQNVANSFKIVNSVDYATIESAFQLDNPFLDSDVCCSRTMNNAPADYLLSHQFSR